MVIQALGLLMGVALCGAMYVALSVIINVARTRPHIVSRIFIFLILITIGSFASTLVLMILFGAISIFSPTLASVAEATILYTILALLPYPVIHFLPRLIGFRIRRSITSQSGPDDIAYLTSTTDARGRTRFRPSGPAILSDSTRYQRRTSLAFIAWAIVVLLLDQISGSAEFHILSQILLFAGIVAGMLRYISVVTLPKIGEAIAHEVTRYIDEIEKLEWYDDRRVEEEEPISTGSSGRKMSVQQARLILGIDTVSVTREQLKRAYNERARKYHPDTRREVSRDEEHMKLLNRAKETLERIVSN